MPVKMATWTLSDINCLATVLHLDPGLDHLLQQRHREDRISLRMREWHSMKQAITNGEEFTLQLLKGVTRLCSVAVTFEGPAEAAGTYPVADGTHGDPAVTSQQPHSSPHTSSAPP